MNGTQALIRHWMARFGQQTPSTLTIPDEQTLRLRLDLIHEEYLELHKAMGIPLDPFASSDEVQPLNVIETIDGLCDILVVTYGAAVALGVDLEPFMAEVMRSNFSKLGEDGKPIFREDGKVLKGPGYTKPDLVTVLDKTEPNINTRWAAALLAVRNRLELFLGIETVEKIYGTPSKAKKGLDL